MDNSSADRYQALHGLTPTDRQAIYNSAMKRSDEIIRGVDEDLLGDVPRKASIEHTDER